MMLEIIDLVSRPALSSDDNFYAIVMESVGKLFLSKTQKKYVESLRVGDFLSRSRFKEMFEAEQRYDQTAGWVYNVKSLNLTYFSLCTK